MRGSVKKDIVKDVNAISAIFKYMMDKSIGMVEKVIIMGLVAVCVIYIVSPIDFVPEMLLPIIGYIDDLVAVAIIPKLINFIKYKVGKSEAMEVTYR